MILSAEAPDSEDLNDPKYIYFLLINLLVT